MDTIKTWLLHCNEKLLNYPSEHCFIGYFCMLMNALEHTAEEWTAVIMFHPLIGMLCIRNNYLFVVANQTRLSADVGDEGN